MAPGDLATTIAGAGQVGGASLRTGRVVALATTTITVDIGGGQTVAMPYASGYTPVLGDTVQVIQQGAVSFVIGASAGLPSDNAVANPSFELDAAFSTTVTAWTKYVQTAGGAVRISTADTWNQIDGNQMLEFSQGTSGTSDTAMISDPITVHPGERWAAAVFWQGYADGSATGGAMVPPVVSLTLTWFVDTTTAYPTTSAADTLVMSAAAPFGAMNNWVLLRDQTGTGTTVPPGITVMRIKLEVVFDSSGVAWFDRVIARKLG